MKAEHRDTVVCPYCRGQGWVPHWDPNVTIPQDCQACDGTGSWPGGPPPGQGFLAWTPRARRLAFLAWWFLALGLALLAVFTPPGRGAQVQAQAAADVGPVERVRKGSSVTFQAQADGSPAPTFTWWKDGAQVWAGETFSIASFNAEHAGRYRVKAANALGEAWSPEMELAFDVSLGPPQILEFRMAP